jgi:hypothetical protein
MQCVKCTQRLDENFVRSCRRRKSRRKTFRPELKILKIHSRWWPSITAGATWPSRRWRRRTRSFAWPTGRAGKKLFNFFFSSSSSPFSSCYILFTAWLTGMSWSRLKDTQGFGMQCEAYIHSLDSFLSRYYGALHRLITCPFPLARGNCPLSLDFCLLKKISQSLLLSFTDQLCFSCQLNLV